MIWLCPHQWMYEELGDYSYWGLPIGVHTSIDFRSNLDCAIGKKYGAFPHIIMISNEPINVDGAEFIGDSLESKTNGKILDMWESLTGVRTDGESILQLIWNHLTENADPLGIDRCKPIIPNISSNIELTCNNFTHSEKFTFNHKYMNKVISVLQDNFRVEFEKDILHSKKVLDYWCDKFQIDKENKSEWEIFIPIDLRKEIDKPSKHSTTITDNFTRANGDILGSSSEGWSWTEVNGDLDIATNMCFLSTSGALGRAESDLSSADHECQHDYTLNNGGAVGNGTVVRFFADNTYYYCIARSLLNSIAISKNVGGIISSVATGSATQSLPDTLKLSVNGSALKFYFNGVESLSGTDTSISGGTRCGMTSLGIETYCDNWSASDLAVAVSQKKILGIGIMTGGMLGALGIKMGNRL